MSSLISDAEKVGILQVFEDSFDTFSRSITIFKEPLKTEISPPPSAQDNLFGFEASQQDELYTYTSVSGIYPAIIRYGDIQGNLSEKAPLLPEPLFHVYAGTINIKVRKDCRDFLNEGTTDRILVDGRTYLPESDERKQTFCGSEYYVFTLRKTQ
ncbi:MAG: hypothetical protein NTZ48_07610 [Candidatus Omnitrophica bacterium]|nr:hypothetical protein [Candidatus Omnitrophota bacterium]